MACNCDRWPAAICRTGTWRYYRATRRGAATAVLRNVRMPRRSVTVLKGERLLNAASTLLLFSAAMSLVPPCP